MIGKILCVIPANGHGGCEYNALSALKYFRDQYGIDVAASFPRVPETEYIVDLCRLNSLPFIPIDCTFATNDSEESVAAQRRATWAILDETSPSVVFIPMPWPKRGQGIIAGCADCGVPAVVKFALVPPSAEPNDFVYSDARAALGRRQVWFANSQFSAELIEKHWQLPPRSVDSFHVGPIGLAHLIPQEAPPSIADARQSVRSEFGLPPNARIAATVARLATQKGYDIYMAAAPAILEANPDLVLLWVGDGELSDQISQWIRASGLTSRIKIAGFRDDVRRLLKASDMFVLPTQYEGGCSQALLEAMEEALPIVVTDTSAVAEVVRHEINGLLVPNGDVEALVKATCRLAGDSRLASTLQENARRDAGEFSAARSFEHTLLRLRRAMSATGIVRHGDRMPHSPFFNRLSNASEAEIRSNDTGFGQGWFEPERAPDGLHFRWMSDEALVRSDIIADRPALLEVTGHSAISRAALDSLEVFVDGARASPVANWTEERIHDWSLAWRIPANATARKGMRIELRARNAQRPCEVDAASNDTRLLSVAISTIRLRSLQ